MQPGAGCCRCAGGDLHFLASRFHIGNAQRSRGFQLLQHKRKRVWSPQFWDSVDGDRIGCAIEAAIDLPLQHAEGAGRRAVEAVGRPGDPVLFVREHKQSQEFAAIFSPACVVNLGQEEEEASSGWSRRGANA
jgi:hypothetical protein